MPDESPGRTRRDVLRAAGVAATRPTAAVGSVALAGSATVRASHDDAKPSHVTLDFPKEWLEKYQPQLDLTAVERNPDDARPYGLYGWRARSPEYETDAAVFWAEYPYQEGILPGGADSHEGDHEPIYVFVDSDTGAIREVVYNAYHWLRGRRRRPEAVDGTHITASVISPWHQYVIGTADITDDAELLGVEDLSDELDEWLEDEDFHDALAPGTVRNPWVMAGVGGREYWWASGRDGISVNAVYLSSALWMSKRVPGLDLGGASKSDV